MLQTKQEDNLEGKEEQFLAAHKTNIARLLETAKQAALEAGKAIMAIYRSGDFEVEAKPDASPLTKADKAAHDIIVRNLLSTGLPVLSEEDNRVSYEVRKNWQWYWLADPLDGTREFIKKKGEFTVNIALMLQNRPVGGVIYAPDSGTLYYGSKQTGVIKETAGSQTRLVPTPEKTTFGYHLTHPAEKIIASRSHLTPETEQFISRFKNPGLAFMGSSLKFMVLAEKEADIYPRFAATMEWDVAAGHALLNALNKGVYQADLKTELAYNKPDLTVPAFVAY